jgi:hypothetical protein
LAHRIGQAARPLGSPAGNAFALLERWATAHALLISCNSLKGLQMAQSNMVTGLFRDRDSAERAYQSLTDRGYDRDDVNLVMSDETRKRHFPQSGQETELGS